MEREKLHIRRGLRALGDCKFPMPSNIVVLARTHRELATNVVGTMLPRKKNYFQKNK